MTHGFRFQLRLLCNLLGFSLKIRPETGVSIGIGILSSALEVASLAILVPLTLMASHQPISPTSGWHHIASQMGLKPNAAFFIVAFFLCLFFRTITQMIALTVTNHVVRQLNAAFSIRALEAFVHHLSF